MKTALLPQDASVVRLVVDRLISLDTVRVYVRRAPSPRELKFIDGQCGSMTPWMPMPHQGGRWPAGACLHQPTYEALRFIKDEFPGHLLCRVDPALDLTASNEADALAIGAYLDRHLVQRWHRGPVNRVGSTTYSKRAGTGVVVVRYADRVSKVDRRPCAHIEWRLQGAAIVQEAGFQSLDDIFAFDARSFWRKRLQLRELPTSDIELMKVALLVQGMFGREAAAVLEELDSNAKQRRVRDGAHLLRASMGSNNVGLRKVCKSPGRI